MEPSAAVRIKDGEHFPRPFRKLLSPRIRFAFFAAIAFCSLVVVQGIARDNQLLGTSTPPWIRAVVSLKLLSGDAAFTLLVTLVGAYLAYHQFSLAQQPHLSYNGIRSLQASFDKMANQRFYTVVLRNGGGGPAQVRRASYRVSMIDGPSYEGPDYSAVMAFLRRHDVVEGRDFMLYRLAPGETIRAGGDWLVLEIVEAVARERLEDLDITLEVGSVVGGLFSRQIFCIPRRWNYERREAAAARNEATPEADAVAPEPSGNA